VAFYYSRSIFKYLQFIFCMKHRASSFTACAKALLDLTVPSRLIIPVGSFLAGLLILSGSVSFSVFVPLVALALADLASSVLNSVSDVDTDRANKLDRPMVLGAFSASVASFFAVALFLVSLAVSVFFLNVFFSLVLAARFLFELLYSNLGLKKVFVLNHLLVGITYGLVPLLAAWAFASAGSASGTPFPSVFFFFFFLVVFMTPFKDIPDYYGDKAKKTVTLPVFLGLEKSKVFLPALVSLLFLAFFCAAFAGAVPFFLVYPAAVSFLFLIPLFVFAGRQADSVANAKKPVSRTLFTCASTGSGVAVQLIFAAFYLLK
jgi:4-hydroxybenzoate polyprenyltransferase